MKCKNKAVMDEKTRNLIMDIFTNTNYEELLAEFKKKEPFFCEGVANPHGFLILRGIMTGMLFAETRNILYISYEEERRIWDEAESRIF